jgi:hypothetical protein
MMMQRYRRAARLGRPDGFAFSRTAASASAAVESAIKDIRQVIPTAQLIEVLPWQRIANPTPNRVAL